MANRIVGNVYIIDTGSANTALPWLQNTNIQSIRFWGSTTAAQVIFTGADTTNVVARLAISEVGTLGGTDDLFLGGIDFSEMKVPTLTAGTAWIYFA